MFAEYTQKAHKLIPSMSSKLFLMQLKHVFWIQAEKMIRRYYKRLVFWILMNRKEAQTIFLMLCTSLSLHAFANVSAR